MSMKSPNHFNQSQPTSVGEKTSVAREVMGLDEGESTGKVHAPKFHSLHIASAENGVTIDHVKKSNPAGPDKVHKIVVAHDHPVMKHIQAIHEHCEDCTK